MTEAATSFPKDQIKVLLLENMHPTALEIFAAEGFQVEALKGVAAARTSWPTQVADVHVLGIRSKTQVTPAVLDERARLLDARLLLHRHQPGRPRRAPTRAACRCSTRRSRTRARVAELMIAEIVMLARQLGDRSREVHEGKWRKVAAGCHEVRGKTLGIVGYGHIGTPGRRARRGVRHARRSSTTSRRSCRWATTARCASLDELLERVGLRHAARAGDAADQEHDRRRPSSRAMKQGAYLLNASRGTVVDIAALADGAASAATSRGAAVDVYPEEPEANSDGFESPLQRPAQRDPDAAHRRLDRGGAGGDRPRGGDRADQVRQHRRDDGRGQLPAGRAAAERAARTAS